MSNVFANPFEEIKLSKRDKIECRRIASTWNALSNLINTLDEETLVKLVRWELDGRRRMFVLNRLKSRHNRQRDIRERTELFKELIDA